MVPSVEFEFQIRNGSVFWLNVDEKLEGFIEFDNPHFGGEHHLGGQLLMKTNIAKNLLPGNVGRFAIEQRLSREEAEMIAESTGMKDAKFKFDRLFITIVGADASRRVDPKPLRIRWGITVHSESFELLRD